MEEQQQCGRVPEGLLLITLVCDGGLHSDLGPLTAHCCGLDERYAV